MPSPVSERIARAFHEAYERLAPRFGYKTRESSAVAWEDVPASNKELMIATVNDLRINGVIRPNRPSSGLHDPMGALADWHDAIGQRPFLEVDEDARIALLKLRLTLIEEEFKEVKAELEAGIRQDGVLAHLAKELADLLYVTYGTAQILDIPLDWVFEAVHANNMTKVDPETGQVRKREDGKILKPDWYRPLSDDYVNAIIMGH
ncbi:hypothetical protein [Microbispora sp. NPDC049633]|uniref:hypothetical protein n=1 Tax=Microbispora sp. NPDC049633 TaxID=3154355 RepID=UPI0034290D1A